MPQKCLSKTVNSSTLSAANDRAHSGYILPLLLFAACLASATQNQSGQPIAYTIDATQPANHLVQITMQVPVSGESKLDFEMPQWYPGRYSIYNFAVNVQQTDATCSHTRLPLSTERVGPHTWRVTTSDCALIDWRYHVYGNTLSGSFAQFDGTHIHFGGGPVLMYVDGRKADPAQLTINIPAGWHVVSPLSDLDQRTWSAPNYDVLIDSPVEAAPDLRVDSITESGREYRVATHSYAPEGGNRRRLLDGLRRIIRTENAILGPPDDLRRYTFLIHFDPSNDGDGMEHLYGTDIVVSGSLQSTEGLQDVLQTAAHEFLHQWNVKRLRPVELGPWNYEAPDPTRCLWIAEGLTSYYGRLTTERAGLISRADYLSSLGHVISHFEQAPGHSLMSADVSSLTAWFHDATPLKQEANYRGNAISYYSKGELLGLLLDLDLRQRTGGTKSLDDVMRLMWHDFYLGSTTTYYFRGHGYTQEDFRHATESVAGSSYEAFFQDYVSGTVELPYGSYLSAVGFALSCKAPVEPFTGITLDGNRVAFVYPGSPAERSGFAIDDMLTEIDGAPFSADAGDQFAHLKLSTPAQISVTRHLKPLTLTLTPERGPALECYLVDVPSMSDTQRRLRESWLKATR